MRIRLFSTITGISLLLTSGPLFSQQLDYRSLEKSIQDVVKKVAPATVSAHSYDTTAKRVTGPTFSAVVVSEDGLILTAAHASSPDVVFQVIFPDGKTVIAKGLGSISENDAAIMKILTKGNYPHAEMGYSSSLTPFQPTISMGYPANMRQSGHPLVRFGHVNESKLFPGFLCNTALMEPGDSGGPLFDLNGRVIGIHSRIWQSMDANYEVPVDKFRKYWDALLSGKFFLTDKSAPEQKIPEMPAAYAIKPIPELEHMPQNFSALLASVENTSFSISSKKVNETLDAMGTLIAVPNAAANTSYIISKSSIVGNDAITIEQKKKMYTATVVSRDSLKDLVLLKVNADLSNGIKLFQQTSVNEQYKAGKFLLSATGSEPALISVVSSPAVSFIPRNGNTWLGLKTTERNNKVYIDHIPAYGKISGAKLKTGDRIVSVNGVKVNNNDEYGWEIGRQLPGTVVVLKGKRHGFGFSRKIQLQKEAFSGPNDKHPAEQFEGGKSVRNDSFRKTFIHDARLFPSDCGSPVFDSEGRFMGINIARVCRTSSVAIPADEVKAFLQAALKI